MTAVESRFVFLKCRTYFWRVCLASTLALAMPALYEAKAQTLAGWEVNGLSSYGTSPFAASTDGTGVAVGSLTRSNIGTGGTAAGNAWGGSGFTTSSTVQFTISVDANYSVDYSSLQMRYRRSTQGPASASLSYTKGGSSSNITTASFSSTSSSGADLSPVTLSSITGLQDVTSDVTFQFTFVAGSGNWYIYNTTGNDLAVNGTATLRSAGTLTWDGGATDANWNTYSASATNQSNWNANNIPTSSLVDSLQFAGSTRTTTNNNITGLTVGSITFNSGAGAFTNNGNTVSLTGGITNSSSNIQTINHGLNLSNGAHTVNASTGNIVLGGVVGNASGATTGSISKTGSFSLTLSGNNSFSGGINVGAGTVILSHNNAAGTGGIVVNGGNVVISSGITIGNNISFGASGGKVSGPGSLGGSLTLNSTNQVLAPGSSPGTMAVTGSQAWSSFTYQWEINSWEGTTAGTNFDVIAVTGGLDLTGASANSIILDITSLLANNTAGEVPGFSEIDRSWTIVTTTTGITGFDLGDWDIITTNFDTAVTPTGSWSLSQVGNNLQLNYNIAVPEPGALSLAVVALLGAGLRRRKSRA